jgi:hypothetical protein
MNLQRLKQYSTLPWNVLCVCCNKWEPESKCYADLDGEPFKAFYCEKCGDELKKINEQTNN